MSRPRLDVAKMKPIIQRLFIVLFSSAAILTTAQSCTIPNPFSNQNNLTLGILKKGDARAQSDNFVKANAVRLINGQVNPEGLTTLSGVKLIQFDSNTLLLLTSSKGIFRTDDGGRVWQRKYILPVGSSESDQQRRNQEISQKVARNDALVLNDIAFDPTNRDVIYAAGADNSVGKIYQSIDGGNSFTEIYTEVANRVSVNLITVDPRNPLRVYAVLDGGGLIRSLDGGLTWRKIQAFEETPIQIGFVEEFNGLQYILFPSRGMGTSTDDGQTWTNLNLTKEVSNIGEDQPSDSFTDRILNDRENFGNYEKVIPVTASGNNRHWMLIADRQLWFTTDVRQPFKKMVLPLQNEQNNLYDAAPDPKDGLERVKVAIDNKYFETRNRGESWDTTNRISQAIGRIGQIIIDQEDSNVVYLMMIATNARRVDGIYKVSGF